MIPGGLRLARRLLALALLLLLVAVIGGCGGGSTGAGTTAPTASAPDATAPPADATQPGTDTATTPPATTTQPAQTQTQPSGGDGDRGERAARRVRVPATFTVTPDGRLQPRTITVPAFIAVKLTLRTSNADGHYLAVKGAVKRRVDVLYGEHKSSVMLPGMRPGRYQLVLDFHPAGTLVVGGEAGP